jgi:hypothetical protein
MTVSGERIQLLQPSPPLDLIVPCLASGDRIVFGEGTRTTPERLLMTALRQRPGGGRLVLCGGRFLPLACGVGFALVFEVEEPWPRAMLEPLLPWLTLVRGEPLDL